MMRSDQISRGTKLEKRDIRRNVQERTEHLVMNVDTEVGGVGGWMLRGWWDRQQMEHLLKAATTRNIHSGAVAASQRSLCRERNDTLTTGVGKE